MAKARTQALALIGKLRDALDADLIVDAVVVQTKAACTEADVEAGAA